MHPAHPEPGESPEFRPEERPADPEAEKLLSDIVGYLDDPHNRAKLETYFWTYAPPRTIMAPKAGGGQERVRADHYQTFSGIRGEVLRTTTDFVRMYEYRKKIVERIKGGTPPCFPVPDQNLNYPALEAIASLNIPWFKPSSSPGSNDFSQVQMFAHRETDRICKTGDLIYTYAFDQLKKAYALSKERNELPYFFAKGFTSECFDAENKKLEDYNRMYGPDGDPADAVFSSTSLETLLMPEQFPGAWAGTVAAELGSILQEARFLLARKYLNEQATGQPFKKGDRMHDIVAITNGEYEGKKLEDKIAIRLNPIAFCYVKQFLPGTLKRLGVKMSMDDDTIAAELQGIAVVNRDCNAVRWEIHDLDTHYRHRSPVAP